MSFRVFNHTDLQRSNSKLVRELEQIRNQADVIIFDEAHHFRDKGTLGIHSLGGHIRKLEKEIELIAFYMTHADAKLDKERIEKWLIRNSQSTSGLNQSCVLGWS